MDELQARTIIETLCKGIDPLTGLDIKPGDLCADKTIQEALKLLLDNCTIESTDEYYKQLFKDSQKRKELKKKEKEARRARKRTSHIVMMNQGKPWTCAEEETLLLLAKRHSVGQIASIMERSPGEIESRLAFLAGEQRRK